MIRKNLEKIMKTLFISFITLLFFSASLQADVVTGIFQTEKNEEGNEEYTKEQLQSNKDFEQHIGNVLASIIAENTFKIGQNDPEN